MALSKIRVLVVDDAAIIRRLVSEVLSRDDSIEVIGSAPNGRIALQKLPQLSPDLVTLDVEMPEMGGIETLKEMRKTYPNLPVIMLSSMTLKGAEATLEALEAGATDYVAKPSGVGGMLETMKLLEKELLPLVKARFEADAVHVAPPQALDSGPKKGICPQARVVCIGSSTGGPKALVKLFTDMAEELPTPTVIVQHMPPLFTKTLAERLDRIGKTRFFEASDGQELEAGCAYIAPGGRHMEVVRDGGRTVLRLNDEPPENSCRPAVDVLFRSVAKVYGSSTLAVVLTGMGRDGLRGCERICERGGRVLAQDAQSSVVWGMPGVVSKAGLADETLPLDELGDAIRVRTERRGTITRR